MSRQVKARRVDRRKRQLRELWLAGVGAASIAQRQAADVWTRMQVEAGDLRARAARVVLDVFGNTDAALHAVRMRINSGAQRLIAPWLAGSAAVKSTRTAHRARRIRRNRGH